ncbi:MAG: hypothetical protein IJK52_04385, partial [Oscillospiraceae bacterium]|nr:hypothetical protein [Oscillospiraceae bacterium]
MNLPFSAGLRRAASVLLSLGALWTVSVTAGSENAASAAQALREAATRTAARLELGANTESGLSTAALLALRQTPLLYSARDNPRLFPEAEPDDAPSDNATPDDSDAPSGDETPNDNETPSDNDAPTNENDAAPIPLQE